ncbi:MAG: PCRF domain-containing protein, partial [Candidatus Aureabacteria bacterium]|nr:PCRF domain-containing protein [Candidatus Auribacterota bacterium]
MKKKMRFLRDFTNSGGIFDISSRKEEYAVLQGKMSVPDFWNNKEKADEVVKKVSLMKSIIEPFESLEKDIRENAEMIDLISGDSSFDESELREIDAEIDRVSSLLDKLEFKTKMRDPDDINNAILSINAGAGGTESCDWASMLFRMYRMWAEKNHFDMQVLDVLPGEEAGIKNTTFIVKGPYAFGHLKS